MVNKKIVCLGGGIGTVNLISGLCKFVKDLTVVVSMADDGGSSGRLRRLYNAPPPGDLVSCMAAVVKQKNPLLSKLLTYRFKGDRYGKDHELGGQKLGNLILIAMRDIAGDFDKGITLFQNTFGVSGAFLPATEAAVSISAETIEGKRIYGEEKIDLGKYSGKRILRKVFLAPKDAKANPKVLESLRSADMIIAGPGDLYTTILPVLIVREIKDALLRSQAQKIFVVNVANKPFETSGYSAKDYVEAVRRHLGSFPFQNVIINSNTIPKIPSEYSYHYVLANGLTENPEMRLVSSDIVDEKFPLYHDSSKLAKTILENI